MFGWRRKSRPGAGDTAATPAGAAAAGGASATPAVSAQASATSAVSAQASATSAVPAQASAAPGDADALLRRLEWTVVKRLDGLLQGDYRTVFRGFGLDLSDLREYQPSDDVRFIDWNVTARMQQPYVREFHEDRELAAWFVVDRSASLDFGSGTVRKRELAVSAVAVLARLFARYGNRVGAVLHGDGADRILPARAGRRHVLHLLDTVMRAQPPAPARGAETDLASMLETAARTIRRRSLVFVLSDFISRPGWGRALGQLARRHEVVALRVFDPLERDLPDLGLVVMQDAETGEQMFVDTRDRAFRARYASLARARETALRETLAEAGVDCLELATDEPLDAALLRFARLRKQRSRLAAGAGVREAAAP